MAQLTRWVGLLKKLASIMPGSTLRGLVAGLFTSKVLFGLALYGSSWTRWLYRDTRVYKVSTTKEALMALQRLQTRAMRLLVKDNYYSLSTEDLLQATGLLSVHQMCHLVTL